MLADAGTVKNAAGPEGATRPARVRPPAGGGRATAADKMAGLAKATDGAAYPATVWANG